MNKNEKLTSIFKKPQDIAIVLGLMVAVGWISNEYLTDPKSTRTLLENNGYTDIQIGKHAWTECGDTLFSIDTKFTATNEHGKTVSGAYCNNGVAPRLVINQ